MVIQTCVTRCARWRLRSFERLDKRFDPKKFTSLPVNKWAWWVGRKCCQMRKRLYALPSGSSITLESMAKASHSRNAIYIMYLIMSILSLGMHQWSDHVFGKHNLSFQLLHQRTRIPWKSDATTCVMGRFSSKAKSMGSCHTSNGEFNPRLYRPPHHHSYGSIEKAKPWPEHIQGELRERGAWIGNGRSITCFD